MDSYNNNHLTNKPFRPLTRSDIKRIQVEFAEGVQLVGAAKACSPEEVLEAIEGSVAEYEGLRTPPGMWWNMESI